MIPFVSFFTQDLVSRAASSDFDQSSQIVDARDYLRLFYWQFSGNVSGSSFALQEISSLGVWQKLNKIFIMSSVLSPWSNVCGCTPSYHARSRQKTVRFLGMYI